MTFDSKNTFKKVTLVKENSGTHAIELMNVNEQVKIPKIAPKCTYLYQQMDMRVIEKIKKKYKSRVLRKILDTCNELSALALVVKFMRGMFTGIYTTWLIHV